MGKINKTEALKKAYNVQSNPFTEVNIADVSNEMEPMVFFGINENEIIEFQDNYTTVDTRPMFPDRPNSKAKEYVIPVKRINTINNQTVEEDSLFSLNTLNRRNIKGEYLYADIANEGGLGKRIAKLCSMKRIKGGAPVEFDAPAFTNGVRDYVVVTGADGKNYRQPKIDRKTYVPISQA